LKKQKKTSLKKLYWLLAALVVAVIIVMLCLYKPLGYIPSGESSKKEVTTYVTHVLGQGVYNYAQRQEPFDLVIPQERTEDIINLAEWPQESGGVKVSRPKSVFEPGEITLMGTLNIKGVDVFVTVTAEPTIDELGLLNLHLAKVKVGAANITLVARAIAAGVCKGRFDGTDTEKWESKIAGSLLNDEPFEPIFSVDKGRKEIRIERITLEHEKLTIRFVPAFD